MFGAARCARAYASQREAFHLQRSAAVVMAHHYVSDRDYLKALLPVPLAYLGLMGPRMRAEKMLQDMGAKLAPADKAAVESAIESLKTSMTNNDTAGMNRAMEQLTQAQHKAAEALYKQAGTAAGSEGAPGGPGTDPGAGAGTGASSGGAQGDVIDAEVVDEEKK